MSRTLAMLHHRATVRRRSMVGDGQGAHRESYATVAADVPCRLSGASSLSALAQAIAGQERPEPPHSVYFLPDQDVRQGDWLDIGTRRFEVATADRQADGAYLKAQAREIRTT